MTIGLYTIVKDEHEQLPRLLTACESFCSHYLICDTGSEDDTREIARSWLADHPGELVERPWDDSFANALNFALDAARRLDVRYLFQTGAGEHPTIRGELPELDADVYMLRQVQGQPPTDGQPDTRATWWLPRLHKRGADVRYIGRTHSYLHQDGLDVATLPAVVTEDNDYEADRQAKHERDKRLLELDHIENPTEPRWVFYLAQTERCLGNIERAADLYHLRSNMDNGWDEERWFAAYMEGVLRNSTHLTLCAWEGRPWRAEPLRALAAGYRAAGSQVIAAGFDRLADEISYPTQDFLFVEPSAYTQSNGSRPAS